MSSTRLTRTHSRNKKQNQGGEDSLAGGSAPTDDQDTDNDITPTTSRIEIVNLDNNSDVTEELTRLGWKLYTLEEKNMKMKLHSNFLKTCMEEDIIPKGLTINKTAAIGEEDQIFYAKWNDILRDSSRKLTECLVEHYERQLARNVATIMETYESLEKIENWTESDKTQLEEEIKSIIDAKEEELKEQKQKKLEAARKSKKPVQCPNPSEETYAEVLKRHIREKLVPTEDNESTRRTTRLRGPRYKPQRDQRTNKETRRPQYKPQRDQRTNKETSHARTNPQNIHVTNNNKSLANNKGMRSINHNGDIFWPKDQRPRANTNNSKHFIKQGYHKWLQNRGTETDYE